MMQVFKVTGVFIIFLVVLFFIKTIFSIVTGLEEWIVSALSLGVAGLVSWYSWTWFSGRNIGAAAAILSGVLIFGSFGFIFGFLGPMLIAHDTQQGTTIGIFIASPLGMLIGGIAGYFLVPRQDN